MGSAYPSFSRVGYHPKFPNPDPFSSLDFSTWSFVHSFPFASTTPPLPPKDARRLFDLYFSLKRFHISRCLPPEPLSALRYEERSLSLPALTNF
ncbi:hypothetical protein M430DRAFT_48946 [Amorphotheca resinae ATCC 22711]|uniref:Uncharacterized protein n=1 Tax=Amorphotheca resinae ATCC 22711 TaxID=857342 RepID=A0A2T3B927_AMORE|nr:hypothetical protein M430DRAFT_48946 [Amorphotheca resinae ATCC 22711]PSS23376.1 hypothetical protein M430DRAFT_48946 [Amorphotheca resinae ATCC 22711]